MKAIHNYDYQYKQVFHSVNASVKIQFWKLFTTRTIRRVKCIQCECVCKNTILKAIHNINRNAPDYDTSVNASVKIQFWKLFTTNPSPLRAQIKCECVCKNTILKAIHNIGRHHCIVNISVNASVKIQFWKLFTTRWISAKNFVIVWMRL